MHDRMGIGVHRSDKVRFSGCEIQNPAANGRGGQYHVTYRNRDIILMHHILFCVLDQELSVYQFLGSIVHFAQLICTVIMHD